MWASLLVWLIAACVAQPVSAQDPRQSALARALFEEGVTLADRGDWVGAADRFERAYALKPTSGVAYNWGSALIEVGRLVEARELLRGVQRDPAAASELKADCEEKLSPLATRIAQLRVQVEGEGELAVEIDGRPLPRAAWNVSTPLDPGAHVALLREGQAQLAREEFALREGEARDVILRKPPPAVVAPQAAQPVRDEPVRKPLYKRWQLWTAVGAVALGGAVTTLVLATRDDARKESPAQGNAVPGVLRW